MSCSIGLDIFAWIFLLCVLFMINSFFFWQNNASNDGNYVFFTGQENYIDFAKVDTWNGER